MGAWFTTVDQRHVYDGFSRVRIDTIRTPDGDDVTREVVEHDDAVAIVPVTDDGQVLLLKQYRQPFGGYVIEVPAGTLDIDGEHVEEAARRELREELHHDAAEFRPLTTFLNSAGWCTERTHVLLARGLRQSPPPDGFVAEAEEADMEVVPIALADAVEAVHNGTITDGKTVIGLLLAHAHLGG
jgi:8-oxo-dGDP phosphatase